MLHEVMAPDDRLVLLHFNKLSFVVLDNKNPYDKAVLGDKRGNHLMQCL